MQIGGLRKREAVSFLVLLYRVNKDSNHRVRLTNQKTGMIYFVHLWCVWSLIQFDSCLQLWNLDFLQPSLCWCVSTPTMITMRTKTRSTRDIVEGPRFLNNLDILYEMLLWKETHFPGKLAFILCRSPKKRPPSLAGSQEIESMFRFISFYFYFLCKSGIWGDHQPNSIISPFSFIVRLHLFQVRWQSCWAPQGPTHQHLPLDHSLETKIILWV